MWPGEDATSWPNDAASDCLALPVLFRKYQSPPTQSLHNPFDANVPPVACRIWGMLFEIVVPVHRQTYCARPPCLQHRSLDVYYRLEGYASNDGCPPSASHDGTLRNLCDGCELKILVSFVLFTSCSPYQQSHLIIKKTQRPGLLGLILCVLSRLFLKDRVSILSFIHI